MLQGISFKRSFRTLRLGSHEIQLKLRHLPAFKAFLRPWKAAWSFYYYFFPNFLVNFTYELMNTKSFPFFFFAISGPIWTQGDWWNFLNIFFEILGQIYIIFSTNLNFFQLNLLVKFTFGPTVQCSVEHLRLLITRNVGVERDSYN